MAEENKNSKPTANNSKENQSRRTFIKVAGAAAGAAAIGATLGSVPLIKDVKAASTTSSSQKNATVLPAFYQSSGLSKFTETMRGVAPIDPNGIPVAASDGTRTYGSGPGAVTADHYTIDIKDYNDTLHSSFGVDTTHLRGYHPVNQLGGSTVQRHLGGILIVKKGRPTQITFNNKLAGTHPIPIDRTIMGAGVTDGDNRADVHLHGGFVPWISDGGPYSWFGPQGTYGASMPLGNYLVLNPNLGIGQAEYYYPNQQSARLVWYHDHTLGITRMNAYVGIASAYIIRDDFEKDLITGSNVSTKNPGGLKGLPDYIESTLPGAQPFELPIIIQDKIFVGANITTIDPTWTGPTTVGSLWYAHTYDPKRYKLLARSKALPDPSVVPEFFGDTMLANGKVCPKTTVEARRYRLRILNACQARFLNLQLYVADTTTDKITLNPATLAPTNSKGPDFLVLGNEGGFLPKVVSVPSNNPFNPLTLGGSLITAPAERWDVIVDFSGFAGKQVILYNDAPAPFPIGDPRNDYFPGAPNNPTITSPGSGPNTRQILMFDVVAASSLDPPINIIAGTDLTAGNDPLPCTLGVTTPPIPITRYLTLNEDFDALGRLIQMLGTNTAPVKPALGFGRAYTDPATEVVQLTSGKKDEVWQIINLTGDTHPIHFHLVNVQIINRQTFNVSKFNGGLPPLTGLVRAPDPYECGWKETVRMNPGEVTTVYIPFQLPTVPFEYNQSPRTSGYEYVWHCHILEHEEHDMMRPLVVKP